MSYVKRGGDARRLLEDPAFREASEGLERQIVEQLKAAQLDGKPETERYVLELVRCLQAAARHTKMLWARVEHGKVAEHEIERKTLLNRKGL